MRYIDFSSVKETIGKIYFGICICVFAYAVIGVPILLGMLKKYGVKTEAVITPNTSSWLHRYLSQDWHQGTSTILGLVSFFQQTYVLLG